MAQNLSPYSFYLDVLSQWPSTVALASQWFVTFNLQSVDALNNDPAGRVSLMDSKGYQPWQISPDVISKLTSKEYQEVAECMSGCVFARAVSIPGESVSVEHKGLDYAGYQGPATAGSRAKFKAISMNLLETNASFIDFVIRPWLVLVGHYGLVARAPGSPKNVKCSHMDIIQFAKGGVDPASNSENGYYRSQAPVLRKLVRFFNVVPTNIGDKELNHSQEGMVERSVSFAYDSYSVMDLNTKSYINY